jgi:hypothetical protein
MFSFLPLVIAIGVRADKDVFKSASAKNPSSLSQQYVDQLPKVGTLLPKEVLREKIRRDFMPRLMATENDRAAYELGLDAYEKLNSRGHTLLDLSNKIAKGERIRSKEKKEVADIQEEMSVDLNFLNKKIQEGEGNSSSVTRDALKMMANSIQSYACSYTVTEKTIVNPAGDDITKECLMPFPGSFVMLDQKVAVPDQITITLPDEYDKDYLHPENWMVQHLRRKLWCPSANSAICDGITSALSMPTQNEAPHERDALAQAAGTMQEDPQPPPPEPVKEAAAPRALMEGAPGKALSPGDLIRQQLQANKKQKLLLLHQQRKVQKDKLSLVNQNDL